MVRRASGPRAPVFPPGESLRQYHTHYGELQRLGPGHGATGPAHPVWRDAAGQAGAGPPPAWPRGAAPALGATTPRTPGHGRALATPGSHGRGAAAGTDPRRRGDAHQPGASPTSGVTAGQRT